MPGQGGLVLAFGMALLVVSAARRLFNQGLATLALDAISTPLAGFEASPRQDGQGGRSSAPGGTPARAGAAPDEALDVEDREELP